MKFSLAVATFFCCTTWINLIQAFTAPVQDCRCVGLSKNKVPFRKIKSYTIQKEGVCSIRAVVFQTVKGNIICSDPNNSWAKRVMLKQDRKTKQTTNSEVQSQNTRRRNTRRKNHQKKKQEQWKQHQQRETHTEMIPEERKN